MSWLLAGLAATAVASPNVLVVIVDDLGTDKLTTYQGDVPGYTPVIGDMPVTPMVDRLAADGVRFRNAWANALCSPTRAGVVTGQYGYRTGIGTVLQPDGANLPLRFTTMAEALDPTYATGAFGKWHLGFTGVDADADDDPLDWRTLGARDVVPPPNRHGFEVFDGSLSGGLPSYWRWVRITSDAFGRDPSGDEASFVEIETEYATRVTAESATDFALTAPEPFLALVAFNAAHTDSDGLVSDHAREGCSTITTANTDRQAYRAAVECMDHELDGILGALEGAGRLDDTVIVLLGDNGTDPLVGDPDFPRSSSGKSSPYEAGLHVPLIVAEGRHLDGTPYDTTYTGTDFAPGDLVGVGETSAALVGTLDVFDTVLELAGVPAVSSDATSLAPNLLDPSLAGRRTLYSELFRDVDGDGIFEGFAAVRTSRYKFIVRQEDDGGTRPCQREELYDLVADPAEQLDRSDDPIAANVRSAARANIDGRVTTYESQAGAPQHWLWRDADGPDACN